MNYCTVSSVLDFSWLQVAIGYWKRYPNQFSSHVLTEDIIYAKAEEGKLFMKKLICKKSKIPKVGQRFNSWHNKKGWLVEESIVDPSEKTLTTYTRSISHSIFAHTAEKCVYRPNPKDPDRVLCEKSCWFSSKIPFAARFFPGGYKNNEREATEGFKLVLTKLFKSLQDLKEQEHYLKLLKAEKLKNKALKAKIFAKTTIK